MSRAATAEQIDIDAYNAESARLQQAVGVDPAECLTIVSSGLHRRAYWPEFFAGLTKREYVTPEGGYWREHDEKFHFNRVRNLEPPTVGWLQRAGVVGTQLTEQSGTQKVVLQLGLALDAYLSSIYSTWRIELMRALVVTASYDPEIAMDAHAVAKTSEQLMESQILQTAAMLEVAST